MLPIGFNQGIITDLVDARVRVKYVVVSYYATSSALTVYGELETMSRQAGYDTLASKVRYRAMLQSNNQLFEYS